MKRSTLLALAAGMAVAVPQAQARITKIQITERQSPTFGGFSWPGVGQYEKIVGKAFGEVDPHDRHNGVIVDIENAPRNARGNVEYSFDFYILAPLDRKAGKGKMMYEPPNRGRKTWTALARVTNDAGANGNDPGSAITNPTVLANSFLMPRGYTMMWSGWDASAGTDNSNFNTTITLPVAHAAHDSAVALTGPSFEYFVSGAATNSLPITYPPADAGDKTTPILTHRVHLDDAPQVMSNSLWSYSADGKSIVLASPNTFVANDIYEFSYTAKDPTVNGIGFAAVRDWVSWIRRAHHDDFGNPNPLAHSIKRIYTEISSQPGRFLNDFRNLGFNEDERGRKVFDGHMQWIAAGDGINMNYRFSQPGRTERNRQDHLFLEGRFPFANVTSFDPIMRKVDSRYRRCEESDTCPFGMEIYSANEYWVKAASLLHTTPDGTRDLPESKFTRNFLISSHQHGTGNAGTDAQPARGACQQRGNPLDSQPIQRALFIALDEWATKHKQPPDSRVPRLRDGTLVPPLPQSGMGFPTIPNPFPNDNPARPTVTYVGLKTTRYLFDYGPNFYQTGIMKINPPLIHVPNPPTHLPTTPTAYQDNPANGPIYPSFVPKTDADGNDIAGVRLPDVTVPLATYTGWSLRRGAQADDGCEGAGQMIVFAKTAAARNTPQGFDPRLSVAERYPTFEAYYTKVVKAIDDLVAQRLYLCEDAQPELDRLVANGLTRGVPAPSAAVPPGNFPSCAPKPRGKHDDDDDDDDHDND
jgi:hypothetical protein